jgi:uncharacterized protein YfbU (UPF0304 family)
MFALLTVMALLHSEAVYGDYKECTYKVQSHTGQYHSIKIDRWKPCPRMIHLQQ